MSQEPLPPEPTEETTSEETTSEPASSPQTPTSGRLKPARSPQTNPDLGQLWQQAKPGLKATGIRTLRLTIRTLQAWLAALEAEPPAAQAPRLDRQEVPEGERPVEVTLPPGSQRLPTLRVPDQLTAQVKAWFQATWPQVKSRWAIVLEQVRLRLPPNWNRQLSDPALTGVIAGLAGLLLWLPLSLTSHQPAAPNAGNPAPALQPSPAISVPPELTAAPSPTIATRSPSPSPLLSPSPSPSPVLQRSPEQVLIASIQDQVAKVTEQYADGLIQTVQANFQYSRLIVKVGDGWYGLSGERQAKLANELLARAQKLDFVRLEIADGAGHLLARSPVVGSSMVLLKRSEPDAPGENS